MDRKDIEKQIRDLETRASKVRKQKSEIEKTLAVKEHQYEQALARLKELGIDAAKMKGPALKKLIADTEEELKTELEKLEASISESEGIIVDFNEALG
jgi:chromosome segregation ATPase